MKPEPLPMTRGYFGIGIENGKFSPNVGTLLRSAHSFRASFVFLVGDRISSHLLKENTSKVERQIPLYHYDSIWELGQHLPWNCPTVGIEIGETSKSIFNFEHPTRAVYLLGAEDSGISAEGISLCNFLIKIPTQICLNVATAGSIVMYDRMSKQCAKRSRKLP